MTAPSHKISPQWLDELRGRVTLSGLVGRSVKLKKAGRDWSGLCPFHNEKTPSFTVNDEKRFGHCFGCGWHGDAIRWMTDHQGMGFVDAVAALAESVGLALPAGFDPSTLRQAQGSGRAVRDALPVQRASVRQEQEDPCVTSEELGAEILARCRLTPFRDEVERYLQARGVPKLPFRADTRRLHDLRFCPNAPLGRWLKGAHPNSALNAPAMVALVRRPGMVEIEVDGFRSMQDWPVTGLHVTYLTDDCTAKLVRTGRDGRKLPSRKMLGTIQGSGVVLGHYRPDAPLVVGEGIETTLSGLSQMIDAGLVPPDACAIAALSLNNLQGYAVHDHRHALELWNLRPDPARDALFFAHKGPVTVLVDADMKGTPVRFDRAGNAVGPKIAETRRGPWVIREISGEERADHCARLARAGWLAAGAQSVSAFRPRIGADFNDQGRV